MIFFYNTTKMLEKNNLFLSFCTHYVFLGQIFYMNFKPFLIMNCYVLCRKWKNKIYLLLVSLAIKCELCTLSEKAFL